MADMTDRMGNEAARPVEDLMRMARTKGIVTGGGVGIDAGVGDLMRDRNRMASDARRAGVESIENLRLGGRQFGISGLANRDWQGAQVGMASDANRLRGLEASGGLFANVMQDRTGRDSLNAQLGADSDRLNLQAYLAGMGMAGDLNAREGSYMQNFGQRDYQAANLGQQGSSQIYQGQQNRPSMFSQLAQGIGQIGGAVAPVVGAFGSFGNNTPTQQASVGSSGYSWNPSQPNA